MITALPSTVSLGGTVLSGASVIIEAGTDVACGGGSLSALDGGVASFSAIGDDSTEIVFDGGSTAAGQGV